MSTTAIIVAAGNSQRMGEDKILYQIQGKMVIEWVLRAFHKCDFIDDIVLVVNKDREGDYHQLWKHSPYAEKVSLMCFGGKRRQDSVSKGLGCLAYTNPDYVVIHDAARPLVTPVMIMDGVLTAGKVGGAVAAIPVTDTISFTNIDGILQATKVKRTDIWALQTPQVFRRRWIEEAHTRITEDVTDDATMVSMMGHPVQIYPGSFQNIKLTLPGDFETAARILRERADSEIDNGQE